jgi:DNA-binding NarL/FixJ family response regulator
MSRPSVFLLVEASPFLRPILSTWLEDVLSDSRILIAANGEEALGLAINEKPSYVLVAINLSERTDFELLHQLRRTLPEARIVATSWFEGRWLRDEIRWAGADGFILKHELRTELLPLWGISKE